MTLERRDPIWLIEADVYGVASAEIQAEVRRQGMVAHVVKARPGAPAPRDLLGAEDVPPQACVVFLGTLPTMRHIQLHRSWTPGGWCDFDRLRCACYYAHLGPFLLNQRYAFLPGVEALRHADRLYRDYGREGEVFVRPDGPWKVFPGARVRRAAFEQALAPARYDPETLVLVAEPQTLGREWRLVIGNGEVVAASLYRERGEATQSEGCPEEVRDFARRVLAACAWRPDPLFMLDVGESGDGPRVIELNAFSCAGLYRCDLAPVIEVVSRCARALG